MWVPFPTKGPNVHTHACICTHARTHTCLSFPGVFHFSAAGKGLGGASRLRSLRHAVLSTSPAPQPHPYSVSPVDATRPNPPYTRRASSHQVSQENASIRNPSPSRNEVSVIKMQTRRQDATARGDFQPTKNSPKPPPILQEREMTAREGGKPAWACLAVQAEARISRRMEMVGLEAL